jgi:hypothetical protein
MDDKTIKDALLAIANHVNKTQESHLILFTLVAKKMPGLSEGKRQQLLTAIESDKKRLGLLQDILQRLG